MLQHIDKQSDCLMTNTIKSNEIEVKKAANMTAQKHIIMQERSAAEEQWLVNLRAAGTSTSALAKQLSFRTTCLDKDICKDSF